MRSGYSRCPAAQTFSCGAPLARKNFGVSEKDQELHATRQNLDVLHLLLQKKKMKLDSVILAPVAIGDPHLGGMISCDMMRFCCWMSQK